MDDFIREIVDSGKWVDDCFKRSDLLDYHSLMDIGIETGNHIRKLMVFTLGSLTEDKYKGVDKGFELCDAVIVGHLVRIYKLYDQLVYFVSENKGEISSIFTRLQFETFVIMKYLIMKGESSVRNFIKTSFKSTIRQYSFIKDIEKKRELIDIEKRIIRKIENRIKNVGLDVVALQQNKNWNLDGLSFRNILNFLMKNDAEGFNWELSYGFIYGSSSSLVHGTWYDIEINQLARSNGKYIPKYTYDVVDPRYILPQSIVSVKACIDFLKWRKSDPDNFLSDVFVKIEKLLFYLNEMDEIRIKNRENGIA